ncbi:MAG: hypothetical protein ACRDNS_34770, partial [Trebonia sp.]
MSVDYPAAGTETQATAITTEAGLASEPASDGHAAEAAESRPLADVIKQTLIYGSGYVTMAVASFVLVPVYTRHLTPSDYGVLGLM